MKACSAIAILALFSVSLLGRAEDWTTTDGKVHKNVTVLIHDDTKVDIISGEGAARITESIPLTNLPPALQKKIGYDQSKLSDSSKDLYPALKKYTAMIHNAVGARWYDKVSHQLGSLPFGKVRIQYTVFYNGEVVTKVLEGDNGSMKVLLDISISSIKESAPFMPFIDFPGLENDLLKKQSGSGESFTDDFTFEVKDQPDNAKK